MNGVVFVFFRWSVGMSMISSLLFVMGFWYDKRILGVVIIRILFFFDFYCYIRKIKNVIFVIILF